MNQWANTIGTDSSSKPYFILLVGSRIFRNLFFACVNLVNIGPPLPFAEASFVCVTPLIAHSGRHIIQWLRHTQTDFHIFYRTPHTAMKLPDEGALPNPPASTNLSRANKKKNLFYRFYAHTASVPT